ncbi:hypothetical protein [Pontivivens ytuae]|uniref:Uncharacterized protein n=1 Tax=Pontivivens ytuae TaxID=2789856 RepID=A0A7S9LTR2_9RHOB|nr:hypothetical protein [Pontivivens ytuae]QPH55141.1 hypothetical protein I0K15_05175 [Pontivivens ytuae]
MIYDLELHLLRLQAHSFARHVGPDLVDEIIVVLNAVDEGPLRSAVDGIVPLYGALAPKVRIVSGDELLSTAPRGSSPLARLSQTVFPLRRWRDRKSRLGWGGYRGWVTQQMMKLALGRVCHARHVVILDGKNVWCDAPSLEDFFEGDGRVRIPMMSRRDGNAAFWRMIDTWLPPSLHAVGSSQTAAEFDEHTTFATPFPVEADVLRVTEASVARTRGGLPQAFLLRRKRPTEFCCVNALVRFQDGTLRKRFAPREPLCISFFGSMKDQDIESLLRRIETEQPLMIGLHHKVVPRLTSEHRQRLKSATAVDLDAVEASSPPLGTDELARRCHG